MILRFSKYHGTGNDFILIDNRSSVIRKSEKSTDLIAHLCHRRFGIGADGLILINNSHTADFEMKYFNSDGNEGSMCGNGGRCAVAFTNSLGIVNEKAVFIATDGLHEANITSLGREITYVKLRMQDVKDIKISQGDYILDTGSPHFVRFLKNVENFDVFNEGRKIRNNSIFKEVGTNVNFAEVLDDKIFVRTYERGVEDETLSCGTGATATAIAACLSGYNPIEGTCNLQTLGGELMVNYKKLSKTSFNDIWLNGPAVCVYKGEINI
jgi:diaminopimelate epimerase